MANPAEKPQNCPRCKAPARVSHAGSYWKVFCSSNICKEAGHVMYTKKDAVQIWNKLK